MKPKIVTTHLQQFSQNQQTMQMLPLFLEHTNNHDNKLIKNIYVPLRCSVEKQLHKKNSQKINILFLVDKVDKVQYFKNL